MDTGGTQTFHDNSPDVLRDCIFLSFFHYFFLNWEVIYFYFIYGNITFIYITTLSASEFLTYGEAGILELGSRLFIYLFI